MVSKLKILSLLLAVSVSVFAQKDTTEIIILHTNDTHSKIDMYPKMAYQVEKMRNEHENVLLVSAGDIFTGNPIVDMHEKPGYPMIELMNLLGYELSCVGNHEFDKGQENLNERMKQANFPFICANIVYSDDAVLKKLDGFYKINATYDISVGFVSFIQLEDNMMPATNPTRLNGLSFVDGVELAKNYSSYKDSADILIALTHLGIDADKELSGTAPFFDAIIGGHSHTYLPRGKNYNDMFITQAAGNARNLGVLTITYCDNEIISIKDSLIDLYKVDCVDFDIQKIVEKYNDNPFFNMVIGIAAENIYGNNELGALMTDAMRDTLDIDFAFQNNGGIRTRKIPKGNITKKQILELSPFGNTFVIYELKLEQIKELIEYSYNKEGNNDIQISGAEVYIYIDENNEPIDIELRDENQKKFKNKKYKIAINDYMANSYQLDFLETPLEETSVIDAEATMKYIEKNSPVNYKDVKRVFVVEK